MPKNILQDVIPKNERTIRRIPIPERAHKPRTQQKVERRHSYEEENVDYQHEQPEPEQHQPAKRSHRHEPEEAMEIEPAEEPQTRRIPARRRSALTYLKLFLALVLVIGIVSFATVAFSKVSVELYPKKYTVPISLQIPLKKTPAASEVPFTTISTDLERGVTVPATGEKKVANRATGTIVVYNTTASEQRLVINTRFETAQGLIYRLTQSVVVPGATTKSGKTTPGSVEGRVQADDTGEKYNIGLTDFTIPGFKGTDKFTAFYGRSKTPMTGGFVGTVKVVDDTLAASKRAELKVTLEKEARESLLLKVPKDYYYFPALSTATFSDLPDTSTSKDTSTLRQKITVTGAIIPKKTFAAFLATKSIQKFDGSDIELTSGDKLQVTTTNAADINTESFSISVKGNGLFTAVIDVSKVPELLAGTSKKSFTTALESLKGLEKAEANIRPLWRVSFPKDPSKIKVTVILDE